MQHESENWLAVAGTGKRRDLVRVLDVTPAGKRQTVDFTVSTAAPSSMPMQVLKIAADLEWRASERTSDLARTAGHTARRGQRGTRAHLRVLQGRGGAQADAQPRSPQARRLQRLLSQLVLAAHRHAECPHQSRTRR